MKMKVVCATTPSRFVLACLLWLLVPLLQFTTQTIGAEGVRITGLAKDGKLTVDGAYSNGVVTVEKASLEGGSWVPTKNLFSSNSSAVLNLELSGEGGLFRVLTVDLTGSGGSWLLTLDDILDLHTLATRLWLPDASDTASEYISGLLSPSTQDLLANYVNDPDLPLRQALVHDFNAIILGGAYYEAVSFSSVPSLSPSTLALLDQDPQGEDLVHLNRMLLEDVYPSEILQKRAAGFTNFVNSYGVLDTVAGSGNIICSACNSWSAEYEGGPATEAALSSPHIAMADRAGNIYIADKRAHAVRKVRLDGTIVTVAGNGQGVRGDTNPAPAVSLSLNNPNGLWVREDGTFYILDRDNGLIRKVDRDGIMSVAVDHGTAIPGGRGLWVNADETVILYSAAGQLMSWDSTNGLTVYADGFVQLGNIAKDNQGRVVVTDSDRNLVIRLETDGTRTVIAGNGIYSGGGDGQLATDTGLYLVRAIWFLPTGGFLVGTDSGSQVWYVDTDGHIHLLLNGSFDGSHAGDGRWFYDSPDLAKVSSVKQITMDYDGNLLITESVNGFVRRVPFLRMSP